MIIFDNFYYASKVYSALDGGILRYSKLCQRIQSRGRDNILLRRPRYRMDNGALEGEDLGQEELGNVVLDETVYDETEEATN